MHFGRFKELASITPTSALCDAWGASPEYVEQRKMDVRSMTIEEAGELAVMHGMKLPDLFAV